MTSRRELLPRGSGGRQLRTCSNHLSRSARCLSMHGFQSQLRGRGWSLLSSNRVSRKFPSRQPFVPPSSARQARKQIKPDGGPLSLFRIYESPHLFFFGTSSTTKPPNTLIFRHGWDVSFSRQRLARCMRRDTRSTYRRV